MSAAPENTLKRALLAGRLQRGLWLNTGSAFVAELVGSAGFDWALIDAEHGPNTLTEILPQVQALKAAGCPAVLRLPVPEVWMVKQALDLGVQTVLAPLVHDGETAARMAAAMRYPGAGIRGMGAALARASDFGRAADYARTANDQVCLFVQAESRAAWDNLDDILAVEGVDGVFVGPADLSADMGYPHDPDASEVVTAIDDIIARTVAAGKIAGIITFDPDRFQTYADRGVTFLGLGGDVPVLVRGLKDLLARA